MPFVLCSMRYAFLTILPDPPAYRSLAIPTRMFELRSRNRKLFDRLSGVLAIKGFYKFQAIGIINATWATTSRIRFANRIQ
jgi:hypothetical protein